MEKQIRLGSILAQYAELLRTHTQEEIDEMLRQIRDKRFQEMRNTLPKDLT